MMGWRGARTRGTGARAGRRSRINGGAWVLVSAGLALVADAGCGQPKPKPVPPPAVKPVAAAPVARPLCFIETTNGAEKPARERTFPSQNWYVLMLHSYRSTTEMARPLADCTGSPVYTVYEGCGDGPIPKWTPTNLTSDDLIILPLGDTRRLVWMVTEHLADGQFQGPIAIASVEPRGLAIRALGVLRSFPEHLVLRVEKMNSGTVLIADGQRCENAGAPEACERAVRILPLQGDHFASGPVVDGNGACLDSSLIPVRSKGRVAGGTKYELEASVTVGPESILIRENLALTRPHAAHDPNAESYISRLQLERTMTVRGGRLVTDGSSLLTRWLSKEKPATVEPHGRAVGALEVPAVPVAQNESAN